MPAQPAGLIFDIDSTLYKNTAYQREQVDAQIRHFARTRGLPFDQALAMVEDARRRYAMQQRASASGNEGKMQKSSLGNALTLLGVPVAESVRWGMDKGLDFRTALDDSSIMNETLSSFIRTDCGEDVESFLVENSTPGGVNELGLKLLRERGFYGEWREVLEKVYERYNSMGKGR